MSRASENPAARCFVPRPPSRDDLSRWGLDADWSRSIEVVGRSGETHRWHLLDTGPGRDDDAPALLCVHGNPTWAVAWTSLLQLLSDGGRRVIAVDQLGMGFSERTEPRTFTQRVDDLGAVVSALDADGALGDTFVLAGHDWGGAISLGWAVDNRRRLDSMVLCNTGIAVPDGRLAPRLIRIAGSAPLRDLVCRRTRTFVEGTIRLAGGRLAPEMAEALRAPYRSADDRAAIEEFVGDVPLDPGHPTQRALDAVAERLPELDIPVLLAWGAKDPVFDDDFAEDLARRLPRAEMHRFAGASHLVMAEADVAGVVQRWLTDPGGDRPAPSGSQTAAGRDSAWARIDRRREDTSVAVADLAAAESISWAELADRVDRVASALVDRGLEPGDRVAMVTPPGVDLVAAVYGVWKAGGVTVVADRGLGARGLGRAIDASRPAWMIGPRRVRAVARALRWAPRARFLIIDDLLRSRDAARAESTVRSERWVPAPSDPAAVLFTSGATGPAKGVRYTHEQLERQRDALATTYGITPDDRLVAAFAPFALYGPSLGIATALPDCDVTKPGTLTAAALDDACRSVGATMAFASPAALANVCATAVSATRHRGLEDLRLVMSAGAPVPVETLERIAEIASSAELHTPYGMTEVLPVTDVELSALRGLSGRGVCVGRPVEDADVRIVSLEAESGWSPEDVPVGVTGEILIRAPWMSDGYDRLWATQRAARLHDRSGTWHRSGDVGHLDETGRLWAEGRAVDVIGHATGPLTSVPIERAVETGLGVPRAAAIGIGPMGTQQLVIVVEDPHGSTDLAPGDLAAAVRAQVAVPVAAVLRRRRIPVDIRHNAKIDRNQLRSWAGDVLAGRRAGDRG